MGVLAYFLLRKEKTKITKHVTTFLENGKKEEKIETVTEEKTITRYDRDGKELGKGEKVKSKEKKQYFFENGMKGKPKEPPQKRFDLFSMSSYEDSGSILTKIKEDSREDEEVTEDNRKIIEDCACSPFPSPSNSADFLPKRKSNDCFKKKTVAEVEKVELEKDDADTTGYFGDFRKMMIKRKKLNEAKKDLSDLFCKKETKEVSSISHKSKTLENTKEFEFPFVKKLEKAKKGRKSKSDLSGISLDKKLKRSIVDLKVLRNEEKHPLKKYMDANYPIVKISKMRKFKSQKENLSKADSRKDSVYSSKTARKSSRSRKRQNCFGDQRRSKTPSRLDFKSIQANRVSSGYKSSMRAKSALRKSYKISQDKIAVEPIGSLTVKQVLNSLKINFNRSYQNSASTLKMPKRAKKKSEKPYLSNTYSKYASIEDSKM